MRRPQTLMAGASPWCSLQPQIALYNQVSPQLSNAATLCVCDMQARQPMQRIASGKVMLVYRCAGDVLLTPEVMSAVGSRCEVAAAPDGHALLLGMPGPVSVDASIDTAGVRHGVEATDVKTAKQKAGHELMALPAQLQLQAVQVIVHLDWQCHPAAND